MTSLWPPDIAETTAVTPASILKQQAEALSKATRNLVEGRVTAFNEGDEIFLAFDLVVPTLQNYTYRLLRVRHGSLMYPVKLVSHADENKGSMLNNLGFGEIKKIEAKNEDEFIQWLKNELASEETQRVVKSLVAQARS